MYLYSNYYLEKVSNVSAYKQREALPLSMPEDAKRCRGPWQTSSSLGQSLHCDVGKASTGRLECKLIFSQAAFVSVSSFKSVVSLFFPTVINQLLIKYVRRWYLIVLFRSQKQMFRIRLTLDPEMFCGTSLYDLNMVVCICV